MPPFLNERLEAVSEHDFAQKHAVGVLLVGYAGIVGVAQLAEKVERAAHIQLVLGGHVKERQVDRAAAAVAGMLGDLALREQNVLLEIGIEVFLHPRILGVERPVHEVRDRLLRTVGVVYLEAVAFRHEFVAGGFERGGGFFREHCQRLLVAVYAVADEVIGRIVPDLKYRVGDGVAEQNEIRRVVREYSSLAFHYIEDFEMLISKICSVLNDGGILLFSQEHPIVTAVKNDGDKYVKKLNGSIKGFLLNNYADMSIRKEKWFVDGVEKYHRTFSYIINTLVKCGLTIEAVDEPLPSEDALKVRKGLEKELIKPTFLIIKARKTV